MATTQETYEIKPAKDKEDRRDKSGKVSFSAMLYML